jgi:hypothetical protein
VPEDPRVGASRANIFGGFGATGPSCSELSLKETTALVELAIVRGSEGGLW